MNQPYNTTHLDCKCIAWQPIVAGALIIIGLSFLLNLFSVAIGLTAFNTDSQGVENLMLGGFAATALGIIASMFAAGWLTGYIGARYCIHRHIGALYGFLAWCIALVLTALLSMHIQNYLLFYTHFISGSNVWQTTTGLQTAVPAAQVVVSAYIVFGLFFLSAFACTLGGHCGMRYQFKNT